MENLLNKEFVLQNGIDFENLHGEYCSDRILDNPFTGLTYELYKNGQLQYYCYYKNGFEEGQYVEFYENGNIKSTQSMKRGRTNGQEKTWFQNGNFKSIAEYELRICLNMKEWDIQGNVIKEKLNPTESDIKILEKNRSFYEFCERASNED